MLPQVMVVQIEEKQLQVGLTLHSDGSGMHCGVGVQLPPSGGGTPPQPRVAHT